MIHMFASDLPDEHKEILHEFITGVKPPPMNTLTGSPNTVFSQYGHNTMVSVGTQTDLVSKFDCDTQTSAKFFEIDDLSKVANSNSLPNQRMSLSQSNATLPTTSNNSFTLTATSLVSPYNDQSSKIRLEKESRKIQEAYVKSVHKSQKRLPSRSDKRVLVKINSNAKLGPESEQDRRNVLMSRNEGRGRGGTAAAGRNNGLEPLPLRVRTQPEAEVQSTQQLIPDDAGAGSVESDSVHSEELVAFMDQYDCLGSKIQSRSCETQAAALPRPQSQSPLLGNAPASRSQSNNSSNGNSYNSGTGTGTAPPPTQPSPPRPSDFDQVVGIASSSHEHLLVEYIQQYDELTLQLREQEKRIMQEYQALAAKTGGTDAPAGSATMARAGTLPPISNPSSPPSATQFLRARSPSQSSLVSQGSVTSLTSTPSRTRMSSPGKQSGPRALTSSSGIRRGKGDTENPGLEIVQRARSNAHGVTDLKKNPHSRTEKQLIRRYSHSPISSHTLTLCLYV